MRHFLITCLFAISPIFASAQSAKERVDAIIGVHILPQFERLAARSSDLAKAANANCAPTSPHLRFGFHEAFDAWVRVSHLRFGPTEAQDRAFALAFWPDSRGATPKRLRALISSQDPIARNVADFAEVSIAARGFYALEFLLYEPSLSEIGTAEYRCQLMRTLTADIAALADDIHADWRENYAELMREPAATSPYRTDTEALQELFKALSLGLQFTSESRLGRPLGSFERPRPNRAEARRSGRSARNVALSLISTRSLAFILAGRDPALRRKLVNAYAHSGSLLTALDDPTFAGVAEPQTRFRIEAMQTSVETIRTIVREELGPALGVSSGFNALDGD